MDLKKAYELIESDKIANNDLLLLGPFKKIGRNLLYYLKKYSNGFVIQEVNEWLQIWEYERARSKAVFNWWITQFAFMLLIPLCWVIFPRLVIYSFVPVGLVFLYALTNWILSLRLRSRVIKNLSAHRAKNKSVKLKDSLGFKEEILQSIKRTPRWVEWSLFVLSLGLFLSKLALFIILKKQGFESYLSSAKDALLVYFIIVLIMAFFVFFTTRTRNDMESRKVKLIASWEKH